MGTDYLNTHVADLVIERPGRSRVFEKFGLDYCCGGHRPLSEACTKKGVAEAEVVAALSDYDSKPRTEGEKDWAAVSMTELADHIEQTHHAFLKQELPRVAHLARKVKAAHGPEHPEAIVAEEAFMALKAELESHMFKEENVLFPIIRQLDSGSGAGQAHGGSVANPIRVMMHEHDTAGQLLAKMNNATSGYSTPDDVCSTYRALMDALATLEEDTHIHIHKENYILFPRAEAREAELLGAPA